MNKHLTILLAALALAPLPADASLVHVGAETVISASGEQPTGNIDYVVNDVTRESLLCYDFVHGNIIGIKCFHYDGAGLQIGPVLEIDHRRYINEFFSYGALVDMDVALADDGSVYVVSLARGLNADEDIVYLDGWNRAGSALFPPIEFQPGMKPIDVAVAATSTGPWVIAFGIALTTIDTKVWSYALATHTLSAPRTIGSNAGAFTQFSCANDHNVAIVANHDDDVAVAWTRNNGQDPCRGSIMARVLRGADATTADRQLSTIVRNGQGVDVSPNDSPAIVPAGDDRFVVQWRDSTPNATASAIAAINRQATIVLAATPFLPGREFRFAADPQNGDFAVVERNAFAPTCVLHAQLAFASLITPLTRFDVGACGMTTQDYDAVPHSLAFRDGQLMLARAYNDRVTLATIDLPAQIQVNNVSVTEGDPGAGTPATAEISVSLTKAQPNEENVQVSFITRSGTAVAGQDYELTRDTVVFCGKVLPPDCPAVETVKTIAIPIKPDTVYEDDERFGVELELPIGAVIRNGDEQADVTILDDDSSPPISANCDGGNAASCRTIAELREGETSPILVTLALAQPVGPNIQVGYSTADGTAQAGLDYVARSGAVQFTPGTTTATIALTVLGDDLREQPETFRLRLSASDGVTLAASELVFHIIDGTVCYLEPHPDGIVVDETGGSGTVQVDTRTNCEWTAVASDAWIVISSPAGGTATGPGALTVDVPALATPGTPPRQGHVTLALTSDPSTTVQVVIDQDGNCGFTLAPPAQTVPVGGGDVDVGVTTTDSACDWIVSSAVPWITVLTPTDPVGGNGMFRYRVNPNPGLVNVEPGPRVVSLASGQFTHTVTQDGCTFDIDQHDVTTNAAGDVEFPVAVTAPSVCRWTAVSNAHWLLIHTGPSGSGNGTTTVFVLDNPTVQTRVGTVSIGDETFTVTQSGLDCDYALAPANVTSCPDGRTFDLAIAAEDGCPWALQTDANWVHLTGITTGSGGDDGAGSVDAVIDENARSATIELRAANIVVATTALHQEGYLTYESFDADRPGDWTYAPSATWQTGGGRLVAQSLTTTAIALDGNVHCTECEIRTDVAVTSASSASGDVVTVLGWYRDDANHVGLAMDEFANRWTLFERDRGTRYSVAADVGKILPGTDYDVRLVFDGTTYSVEIDGVPLLQLAPHATAPNGSAGFAVDQANARFGEMRVSNLAPNTSPLDPDAVFSAGFEPFEIPNLSQCELND